MGYFLYIQLVLHLHINEAQIDYLIYGFTRDVVLNNPNIDNIIEFKDEYRNSYKLISFAFKIRKEKYDIVIDAYNKLEARIIVALSGISKRISYKRKGNFMFNIQVENNPEAQTKAGMAIEHRLDLLKPLASKDFQYDYEPKIYLISEEKEMANTFFPKNYDFNKKTVMFGIYGSVEKKTYPEEKMLKVVNYFASKYDVQILLNYFGNQKERAEQFYQRIENKENVFFDVYSSKLREFAQILTKVDLYIGNDCGYTNISKAMQVPTFVLFAPFLNRGIWGCFEDGIQNDSVHLEDLQPELYSEENKDVEKTYQMMDDEKVIEKIEKFFIKKLYK